MMLCQTKWPQPFRWLVLADFINMYPLMDCYLQHALAVPEASYKLYTVVTITNHQLISILFIAISTYHLFLHFSLILLFALLISKFIYLLIYVFIQSSLLSLSVFEVFLYYFSCENLPSNVITIGSRNPTTLRQAHSIRFTRLHLTTLF